jgi:arginine decarboxylase
VHFNGTLGRLLKFAREFNEKFPGFETDIHGLVKDGSNGTVRYYVDCVAN